MNDELLTIDDIAGLYRCSRRNAPGNCVNPPVKEGGRAHIGKDQQAQRLVVVVERVFQRDSRPNRRKDLARPSLVQRHGCVFPFISFRRHSSTSFDHCSE